MRVILVENGELDWSKPVSRDLRATRHEDSSVDEEATIADYLSHRIGLALRRSNLVLKSQPHMFIR